LDNAKEQKRKQVVIKGRSGNEHQPAQKLDIPPTTLFPQFNMGNAVAKREK
jgi:hypothetical protein